MLILLCFGCTGMQLAQFEKHAARGDHEWIAEQEIDCRKASDGCSRLHLIKADACLRLAEANHSPAVNYACAADELDQGLALKPSWEDVVVQLDYQEKFCDSLSRLQDLQSGEGAQWRPDRFVEAAKDLYQLAPDSVAAVYYLSRSRLKAIEPMLTDINAATRIPVCNRLKRSLTDVLTMMETAKGETMPGWDRLAERYERLAFDLGRAVRTADCR
jgi:hypothetical protein